MHPRKMIKIIYKDTETFRTQQGKTHDIRHPVKNYQAGKALGKHKP